MQNIVLRSEHNFDRSHSDKVMISPSFNEESCTTLSLLQSSLPLELQNEPFSYFDNQYRVEIVVSRPLFSFTITTENARVVVGGMHVTSRLCASSSLTLPTKCSSNVSVLTVFDTYGLEITEAYLEYLSSLDSRYSDWVEVYLVGSIWTMVEEQCRPSLIAGTIKQMCDTIVQELRGIEAQKSKLSYSLVPWSLLPEIVALITQSLRISKEVSRYVIERRGSYVPSLEEVRGRSNAPRTYYESDVYRTYDVSNPMACELVRRVERYSLTWRMTHTVIPFSYGIMIAESTLNYDIYYTARGCDGRKCVSLLLSCLDIEKMEIEEVCSWTVQLSSDMRCRAFENITEDQLRARLGTLIAHFSAEK